MIKTFRYPTPEGAVDVSFDGDITLESIENLIAYLEIFAAILRSKNLTQ
jgi:hypothetical protein